MADIAANGATDRSVDGMLPYGELNDVLGMQRYHELWDRWPDS
jgi:hypothetical protein